MRSVAIVLSLVALASPAAGQLPATRPAPSVTADMSPAEIRTVWAFDQEVLRAARELGLDRAPQVLYAGPGARFPFAVDARKLAFVYPGHLAVVLTPRAVGIRDVRLRCVARHELLHLVLGHTRGSRTLEEQDAKHAEVAQAQRDVYGEDSRCE